MSTKLLEAAQRLSDWHLLSAGEYDAKYPGATCEDNYVFAQALRAAIAEAEAEAAGQAHRQAHSKSEYRRLQAGGVDVLPPAAQAPPDEEWIDETIHAHIPFLRGARPYVAEAARAIASRLRAREEAVQQLCDAVERLQFGSAVAEQELRDALAAVREKP